MYEQDVRLGEAQGAPALLHVLHALLGALVVEGCDLFQRQPKTKKQDDDPVGREAQKTSLVLLIVQKAA